MCHYLSHLWELQTSHIVGGRGESFIHACCFDKRKAGPQYFWQINATTCCRSDRLIIHCENLYHGFVLWVYRHTADVCNIAFHRLQCMRAQWKGMASSFLSSFFFFFCASRVHHCERGAQYPPCLSPVKHISPRCRGACAVWLGDLIRRGSFHAAEAFWEAGFFLPPFLF